MKHLIIALGILMLPWYAIARTAPEPLDPLQMVVGNDLWQAGKRYRNGSDWLALVCTAQGCKFEQATLIVRAEKWQGHYDDQPIAGQKLVLRRPKAVRGHSRSQVVAWLRGDAKLITWLAPGPVRTYASKASPLKRPASEGTLEVAVPLPDGQQATFVPLFDRTGNKLQLQLRAQGQRQMLGELGACSHTVSTGYFLWAGDLDRDGKPDYLISFVDDDGQIVLYLSSATQGQELVGAGATFDAPPFGGECDGSGWLER